MGFSHLNQSRLHVKKHAGKRACCTCSPVTLKEDPASSFTSAHIGCDKNHALLRI